MLACGRMRCSPCCYICVCVSEMNMLYIGQSKSQCVLSQSHTSNSPLLAPAPRSSASAHSLLASAFCPRPRTTPSTSHTPRPPKAPAHPLYLCLTLSLCRPHFLPTTQAQAQQSKQATHQRLAHTQRRAAFSFALGSSFRPSVPERA